jgi:hypothetical protein
VLVAALLLVGVTLLLFQHAVLNGDFTALSQGRYTRIPNDDYVHITYELGRLKQHPPKGTTVYLFGGSGAMESIVSQNSLAAAIAGAGGGQVNAISLAAHQQTLAQTLAIIDNLPPGKAVLLVGLAPSRLTTGPAQDVGLLSGKPIIARSPRLESLAPKLYGRGASLQGVLPGIFDYVGSYLRQRASAGPFWGLSIPYETHYYPPGAKGAATSEKGSTLSTVLANDQRNYAANGSYNFELLRQIVLLARERGYTVVFYDQPLNVAVGGATWGGVLPAYRARAEALAKRLGVPYLHPQAASGVTNADFADLYHLLERGRVKWQPVLAGWLAHILRRGPETRLFTFFADALAR